MKDPFLWVVLLLPLRTHGGRCPPFFSLTSSNFLAMTSTASFDLESSSLTHFTSFLRFFWQASICSHTSVPLVVRGGEVLCLFSLSLTGASSNASWAYSTTMLDFHLPKKAIWGRVSEIILVHRFDRIDLDRIFVYTYILHIYIIPKKNNKKLKKNPCFLLVIYVFCFLYVKKWHLNKTLDIWKALDI